MDSAPNFVNALKCELASEILCSSGSLRLGVTGWSMLPTVMPGDTLTIERISGHAVCTGDIVLFGRDQRLFVHRVVRASQLRAEGIMTRGDAMPAPDTPLPERDLLGRVSSISRNGNCFRPSRTLRFSQRAIAAVVRRSTFAARIVVGVHGMRQNQDRAVPCQN